MKQAFTIPATKLVTVKYAVNGVNYSATIPNPNTNDGLAMAMMKKRVGMSQIRGVSEYVPNVARG